MSYIAISYYVLKLSKSLEIMRYGQSKLIGVKTDLFTFVNDVLIN